VLYMRQEDAGSALVNKVRAYHLQDVRGLDTVDAERRAGFKADHRDYGVGAQILYDLGRPPAPAPDEQPGQVPGPSRATASTSSSGSPLEILPTP